MKERVLRTGTTARVRKLTPFIGTYPRSEVVTIAPIFRADIFPAFGSTATRRRSHQSVITPFDLMAFSSWKTPASGWRFRRGVWRKD
jgi:hypothetical protein